MQEAQAKTREKAAEEALKEEARDALEAVQKMVMGSALLPTLLAEPPPASAHSDYADALADGARLSHISRHVLTSIREGITATALLTQTRSDEVNVVLDNNFLLCKPPCYSPDVIE